MLEQLRDKLVLVIDDDVFSSLLTKSLLTLLGARVFCASSGIEALALTAKTSYDIIFLDLQLGTTDGFELAALLRQQEAETECCRARIYSLTGHSEEEVLEKCLATGMDGCFAKPLTVDALRETIAPWCAPSWLTLQPAAEAVLDLPWLETNLGDRDFCHDTIKDALQCFPEYVDHLRLLVSESRWTESIKAVHRLRGAAWAVGASILARQAGVIEKELMGGKIASITLELNKLEDALVQFEQTAMQVLRG